MTPFQQRLRARLAAGPMPVAEYMALCNAHYYATRDPLGRSGDFTTSPEISQVFGELIGLWLADLWLRAGSPPRVRLVELGPGRGTLMADLWRATAKIPGFHAAATIHLVETSPALRTAQAERVPQATWHDSLAAVPDDAPLFLVANEFFDALPVRQMARTEDGWRERMVVDDGAQLAFALGAPAPPSPARARRRESPLPQAGEGERVVATGNPSPACGRGDSAPAERVRVTPPIEESSPISTAIAAEIGARLRRRGGAALIVDYGYTAPATGDTLQAVRAHAYADPLADPGEADLTAHVDFTALADAAAVPAHGPIGQGDFLTALGIAARTEALAKSATPQQAALLRSGAERLCGPTAMGSLFKALALTGPGWPKPAAFP